MQPNGLRHLGRGAVRRILLLAILSVVVGTVSACGSSGSQGAKPTTDNRSGTGGTKAPLVLGSIISETGPFGPGAEGAAYGVKAWAQYANAHGGVDGHKVEVSVTDDKGVPSDGISAIRAYASNSSVLAVIGNVTTVEASWMPLVAQLKMPAIGSNQSGTAMYTTPYAFPVGATMNALLWGQVYSAVTLNHDPKVGLFYCAEVANCALATKSVKEAASALGGTLVNAQAVSATAPNYDAVCQAAKNAGVQGIVAALGSTTIAAVSQSCASIGYHPVFVGQTSGLTPSQAQVKSLEGLTGVTTTFPWVATDTPAQREAQAAFKAAKVPASAYGAALSVGYAAGATFEAAVKTIHGPITRESLANALWKLKNQSTGGLAPPLNYGPANAPSPQQKCFFVSKVVDHVWTAFEHSKVFCQP